MWNRVHSWIGSTFRYLIHMHSKKTTDLNASASRSPILKLLMDTWNGSNFYWMAEIVTIISFNKMSLKLNFELIILN